MRYYTSTTQYHCGIDLHSTQMYVCVMDTAGKSLLHMNIRGNDFEFFLQKIAPWRHDMTVCCECIFNWYWMADACHAAGLQFVLAHALYLKAIHGGKNKNDRIDSEKLTHLLRSNLIPPSYVYPADKRPIRALFRQRMTYVWQRTELLQRMAALQMSEGNSLVGHKNCTRNKWLEELLEIYENEYHRFSIQTEVQLIVAYDDAIKELEKKLITVTRDKMPLEFTLVRTVPGIGKALGLTIIYEVDTIERFPDVQRFCSYCRLVKGTVASAGKIKGLRGAKLGNAYLRWAFGEAAVLAKRHNNQIAAVAEHLTKKTGCKFKANTILANKLARAVYYMLKNKRAFDVENLVEKNLIKKEQPSVTSEPSSNL